MAGGIRGRHLPEQDHSALWAAREPVAEWSWEHVLIVVNRLLNNVIHATDEGNAVALVLEGWVGEGSPTAFLALIVVAWPGRRHFESDAYRAVSNRYGGDYCISGRADH